MRHYRFLAIDREGQFMNWPGEIISAPMAKIRVVACVMFRKWFGHPSIEHWYRDGFMAEAWDGKGRRRGNIMQVEQINRDMRPIALLPEGCP